MVHYSPDFVNILICDIFWSKNFINVTQVSSEVITIAEASSSNLLEDIARP